MGRAVVFGLRNFVMLVSCMLSCVLYVYIEYKALLYSRWSCVLRESTLILVLALHLATGHWPLRTAHVVEYLRYRQW